MIVLKCYYDIVSKRLIGSYIFFTEGRDALYGGDRILYYFGSHTDKLSKLFVSPVRFRAPS